MPFPVPEPFDPSRWTRLQRQLAVGLGIVVIFGLSLVWLIAGTVANDRQHYYDLHHPTNLTVVAIGDHPYVDCRTENCECTDYPEAPSCPFVADRQKHLQQKGRITCQNGDYCCKTHCDTCWHTCSYCADRRLRRLFLLDPSFVVEGPDDGLPDEVISLNLSRTITIESESAAYCHDRVYYRCWPHDCNCRCVKRVAHRKCQEYCADAYRPEYTLNYPNPAYPSGFNVTRQGSCGIDDRKCVTKFYNGLTLGANWIGWYNEEKPSEVGFGSPTFHWRGGEIAGTVILSGIGVVGLLVAGHAMLNMGPDDELNDRLLDDRDLRRDHRPPSTAPRPLPRDSNGRYTSHNPPPSAPPLPSKS